MLVVLLDQQIHRSLGDRHQPHRVFRLGPGQFQRAVWVADILLAHGDRPLPDVHIVPPQGHQFPLPQAADQFQVEHGEQAPPIRRLQVGFHVLRREDFHIQLPRFWHDAVLAGVPGNEPLLHRPVQGAVEHQVDAVDGGGAQAVVLTFSNMYSAASNNSL